MSGGGPPHHSHNRQVPSTNPAWNHLQVPNYFPRQPQLAHMSAEHAMLHPPTWHTPTATDNTMKMIPHSHMLSDMLKTVTAAAAAAAASGGGGSTTVSDMHVFPRECVDLSLARNGGNQNGELATMNVSGRDLPPLPTTPISLSVRDANKINSLPPSALDIHAVELTKCPGLKSAGPSLKSASPVLKSASPGLMTVNLNLKPSSPGFKSASPVLMKSVSPGLNTTSSATTTTTSNVIPTTNPNISEPSMKNQKRSNIRVDSILERLNPTTEPMKSDDKLQQSQLQQQQQLQSSVIVQATSSYDENSNSSSLSNVPTSTTVKEDDAASMHSNEDSLDSNKSRRKRKPSKTLRVSKDEEKSLDNNGGGSSSKNVVGMNNVGTVEVAAVVSGKGGVSLAAGISGLLESNKIPERRRSSDDLDTLVPASKTRRKTSSESETIDNIAAMVQESLRSRKIDTAETVKSDDKLSSQNSVEAKPISVSVIKSKDNLSNTTSSSLSLLSDTDSTNVSTNSNVAISESQNSNNCAIDVEMATPVVASEDVTICESQNVVALPSSVCPTATVTTTLMTPAQKKATNTHFVEVENKLEEMFAGIEDCDPLTTAAADPLVASESLDKVDGIDDKSEDPLSKLDTIPSTSQKPDKEESEQQQPQQQDVTSSTSNEMRRTRRAVPNNRKKGKKARSAPMSRRTSDVAPNETTPKKKKLTKAKHSTTTTTPQSIKRSPRGVQTRTSLSTVSKKLQGSSPAAAATNNTVVPSHKNVVAAKSDVVKDVYAYDSGSNASSSRSRGPFIQIKGPRDSPISVNVVNTPTNDEDGDRKPVKSKKFHDDSEYRHKVRSKGLHCSTLSNKYDAQTKDTTWICVFCKRGPHDSDVGLYESTPTGDLFGPYIITTQCAEYERRYDDPHERQFKSRKITKVLEEQQSTKLTGATGARKSSLSGNKRKFSETDTSDVYLGITEAPNKTYEVWAHEDCIVWAPNVYLVGPKIVGLEEAVWTCCNMPCAVCRVKGANICCVKRGCLNAVHLYCAREGWCLDQDDFKAYCPLHKVGK